MKKVLYLLTVFVLVLSFAGIAVAQENYIISTESSSVFLSYSSGIDYYNGYMRCNSTSYTAGTYNQSLDMELLEEQDDGSWSVVTSWYTSAVTSNIELRKAYLVESGTYKVRTVHSANGEVHVSYSLPQSVI